MFAGQMGCEALNFLLKRWFKEMRPPRAKRCIGTSLHWLMYYRDVRQGLWHAFIPRAVRCVLLDLPDSLPTSPPQSSTLEHPYTDHLSGTTATLHRCMLLRECSSCQPDLSELSHSQASACWSRRWSDFCRCILHTYYFTKEAGLGGLGSGAMGVSGYQDERSRRHRGPGGCRLGPLGDKETGEAR